MNVLRGKSFRADRPWGAADVAAFDDVTVRLHFTDQPYRWHTNTGAEVFAVLDGVVDMHVREAGAERVVRLESGDVMHIGVGEEHVAHPVGEARILVIERRGSE